MKIYFTVAIEGTEVPPGWAEKTEKKLRKDLKLAFGDNVTVSTPLPPPVIGSYDGNGVVVWNGGR